MEKPKSSVGIIWHFLKQHKLKMILLFVLSLLVGVFEAASVAAVYPILSAAFEETFAQGSFLLAPFEAIAGIIPVQDEFIAFCLVFIFLAILTFIFKYITISYRVRFSSHLVETNQNIVFNKFIRADYKFFTDHKQGELLYNVANAPQRLSTLIISTTEVFSQLVLALSVMVLLFSLSVRGTLIVFFIGAAYQLVTQYLGRKVAYYSGKGEMQAVRQSNIILNEVISGIRQVKIFNSVENWIKLFANTIKGRWAYFIRRTIWQQIPTPLLMLVLYLFVGITVIVIKILVPMDFMDLIPVFGTFAFAVFRLVPIVGGMSGQVMQIMGALPDCETVFEILQEDLSHLKDGRKELSSFESKIEFRDVSFKYGNGKAILSHFNAVFEKGKTTAIVGRSGSGKSTIINLILRLYDATDGEVIIDNQDIREYRIASWLSRIGVVSQDTFIFNNTVHNNITLSLEYPEERIIQAATYADAHSFVSELDQGYDTIVGDRGIKLSGGQQQRLAVARAMIRDPEILIFDEATNALDNISETAVQNAIDELSQNHTVIIVAHRLTTIAGADKIIVIGEGRVLEEGTHKQLMENKGTYWELYQKEPV
jgi:ABC-type multidrug transport system fused ATPase/permease subunit